jgi:hypothetical protein
MFHHCHQVASTICCQLLLLLLAVTALVAAPLLAVWCPPPQDLALCGYSLAKLGLRPPQTWLRKYCTLLLRLKAQLWHRKWLLTQVTHC